MSTGQMELNLPNAARARRSDPETSHAAAASLSVDRLREQQRYVLMLLEIWGPSTDVQLARFHATDSDAPRMSPSGLRTRRAELVRMGKVRDTGGRVVLPTGRKAIVWGLA